MPVLLRQSVPKITHFGTGIFPNTLSNECVVKGV